MELKKALDCIWYEAWMLQQTYILLLTKPDQFNFNLLIESFLTHARGLIYFMQDADSKKDIVCSNFGVVKTVIKLPPSNDLNTISRFLSHLSLERVTKPKPSWGEDIRKAIKDEIDRGMRNFIQQLPDNLFPTTNGKIKDDFYELETR